MRVIAESLFVAMYSVCVAYIILMVTNTLKTTPTITVFFIGFAKHWIGYLSGLHDYYCRTNCINDKIILESIIEGMTYLILYTCINRFFIHPLYTFFFIGFILHLIVDFSGMHKWYCKTRCKNNIVTMFSKS